MTPKSKQRISISAAAELLGKSRPGLSRTLKRAGVVAGPDGKFDACQVFEAARNGALQDKNDLTAAGPEGEGLHALKLAAQVRLLDIQGARAAFELDRVRGEFISKADHRERVIAVYGFAVKTIDVFIKTVSAARADAGLKRDLEEMRRRAYAGLRAEIEPTP